MLEVKFFGEEPEVCIAAVKNKANACGVEVKGSTGDILVMLITIVNALSRKMPSFLIKTAVESAFDNKTKEIFDQGITIDMTELLKQFGK